MAIEELRARKRELLSRKKYELELQARGEGDNLALFIINEELLDVNDQLRALTTGRRKAPGRTAADYDKDRQQYQNWRQEDQSLDGEIDEGRALMKAAAVHGLDLLTPRQREMFELHLSGRNIPEIAKDLGVNKSTVSRTLAQAKKKLRGETERAMAERRLLDESARVDLRDPSAARAVLLAMTPKQTTYFYLYYSECLTLREIENLTSTNHAAICRTLRRALRNIGTLLGGQNTVLENPEALDELAYQAYCELEDHPEFVPEGVPRPQPYRPRERAGRGERPCIPTMTAAAVHVRRSSTKPPGKLLAVLLALREKRGSVLQWLAAVFAAWRRKKK